MTETTLISVVAISENNVIADDVGVPWDYPVDKQQYQARIRGCPLVIGRKTYETMMKYERELLVESDIVVLTTQADYQTPVEQHSVANSKEEAINWINSHSETVYNLGGGQVYELLLDVTDRLIVSHIPETIEDGQVFFPTIDESVWEVIAVEEFERFTVRTYERRT